MSTPRGIFETLPNQTPPTGAPSASPFWVATEGQSAPESKVAPVSSPFVPASAFAAKKESPFAVVSEENRQDDQKTIRLPEKRRAAESPFQITEPQGFGFEAVEQSPQALKASPFEAVTPSLARLQASPFQMEQAPAAAAPQPAPSPSSPSLFGGWPQAEVAPAPAPQAPTPAPQPAASALAPLQVSIIDESPYSDSYSIKQLELRAIFGVDREMTKEEIIQRSRSLPGIRQIARGNEQDIGAVDALKQVISNLGFGNNPLRLYSGSVPIEFIREGGTLLAVQTDGGFAPGVRETLMLVARELDK